MPSAPPANESAGAKKVLLAFLMAAWIIGVWIYVIIASNREREFPKLAHQNLFEYFFVAASFLVAPFIGASCAWRLIKLGPGANFPSVLAWLMLIAFVMVFATSCAVFWWDYRRYGH
jgi:hypothetical protein